MDIPINGYDSKNQSQNQNEILTVKSKELLNKSISLNSVSKELLESCFDKITAVFNEMSKGLVGQTTTSQRLFMALLTGGHVLLEGLPGLAKTTSIKILGEICKLDFKRIQFTPDLLPADITGTQIYHRETGEFKIKKGPVFCNLLLADEINRAPSKVQAALLEAMQEKQVTISGHNFSLRSPFLVLATQNPIDQEGTYTLPEAQLDRFLFKLNMTYGTLENEIEIMQRVSSGLWNKIHAVIDSSDIELLRNTAQNIYISDELRKYIATIVFATRFPEKFNLKDLKDLIVCGASPRASIALESTAKVQALFEKRAFVTPSDVKLIANDILNHRITLSYEAQADNITKKSIISKILSTIALP